MNMSNERYHSKKPGEVILHSNDVPPATEYRKELMGYLHEYPDGNDKNDLTGRLWSYTESGFHSACFELFLYHLVTARCKKVVPHPSLPSVGTHPEFAVQHILGDFFLEATLALESEEYRAQEQRLRELVDAVRDIRGSVFLWAQPVTHLPTDFELDSVRDFLRREIGKLDPAELSLPKTLTFEANLNNVRVIINFEVIGADQNNGNTVVQAWGSPDARAVTTHLRIRRRVGFKATRYGQLDKPYVVAVWPKCELPLTKDVALAALFGDPALTIDTNTRQIVSEQRVSNGVFNTVMNGEALNRQVSAVALYRERFLRTYERQLVMYHNPYALYPIAEEIFLGLPQFVFRKDGDGSGRMLWLNDVNPWNE
ncbi:MAG: hypothetical protein Q7T04_05430 [Dehalococcoidia bacterium]|nr:hypothetical protein [Dehalococcoidia bacterium]